MESRMLDVTAWSSSRTGAALRPLSPLEIINDEEAIFNQRCEELFQRVLRTIDPKGSGKGLTAAAVAGSSSESYDSAGQVIGGGAVMEKKLLAQAVKDI